MYFRISRPKLTNTWSTSRSMRWRKRGSSADESRSDGFVVASCGFQRATASISPVSATTRECLRRESSWVMTKSHTRWSSVTYRGVMQNGFHGLAATNYRVRTGAFAWCFLTVGTFLWEKGAGPVFCSLAAVLVLGYPHLVYLRPLVSAQRTPAELDNLLLDSALLGAWCAALGFPTWISYCMIGATMLNAVVNRGARGLAWSIACSAAGAALADAVLGFNYAPATDDLVTVLCIVGAGGYATAVGYVVYGQNRRLAATRDELQASEERYRMIAENAGDLIGMLDEQGRWVYASPSYERILNSADLAIGSDALRRLHPDDAERARAALFAAAQGKPRDIALRLVDREGRIRQYKSRVQPLDNRRILLVSQDVTDLRESEEKLLLTAHAFEGMTEAIVITAADGTVVTVNRAFCELTGFTRDDVLGQHESAIRNALQPAAFYDEIYAAVARDGYWSGTAWARRKNGSVYREWRSVRAVREGDVVTHYVMVFYEVGAQRSQGDSSAAKF